MVCKQCSKEFQAERSTAKYCSDVCRVKHGRVSVTPPPMVKAPSGRMRPICKLCPTCKYPAWKGELMYPEDEKGVPYCNSEGPLSDREILSGKNSDPTSKHASQTGPYA